MNAPRRSTDRNHDPQSGGCDDDTIATRRYDRVMDENPTPAVGAIAPAITLEDTDRRVRGLDEIAAAGYCVVVFYRGHW